MRRRGAEGRVRTGGGQSRGQTVGVARSGVRRQAGRLVDDQKVIGFRHYRHSAGRLCRGKSGGVLSGGCSLLNLTACRKGRHAHAIPFMNAIKGFDAPAVDPYLTCTDPAVEFAVRGVHPSGQELKELLSRFGGGDGKGFGHGVPVGFTLQPEQRAAVRP